MVAHDRGRTRQVLLYAPISLHAVLDGSIYVLFSKCLPDGATILGDSAVTPQCRFTQLAYGTGRACPSVTYEKVTQTLVKTRPARS